MADKKKNDETADYIKNIKEGFKVVNSKFSVGKIILFLGVIIAAIYGAVSFGAFVGFFIIVGLLIIFVMSDFWS